MSRINLPDRVPHPRQLTDVGPAPTPPPDRDEAETIPPGVRGGSPPGGWADWLGELATSTRPSRHGGWRLEPDDAAQEARLACLEALVLYRGDAPGVKAWLAVVVRNRLANLVRRDAALPLVPLGPESAALAARDAGPTAARERAELVEAVRAALDEARGHLSEASYLAVVLRCGEGRATAEVAAALGLSEGQVRDRCRRALPAFRAAISRRLGPDLLEVAGIAWDRSDSSSGEVGPWAR